MTKAQVNVINKGLNYVPTSRIDKFEFTKDFYRLCRRIRMKMFFQDNKTTKNQENILPVKLGPQSKFDPVVQNSMLEAFQQMVTQEVNEKWDKCNTKQKNNLTKKEKIALTELKKTYH